MIKLLLAVASIPVLAENVMDCLSERPLVDVHGRRVSPAVQTLRQIRVPQSCVPLICSANVLVVAWQLGVQFTSVSIDDTTAAGQKCMRDVQRSQDNYHKANFPVTFYRAGDLQLVFHDSLCPAYSVDKQRFLLNAMLTAKSVQPLEAYIICDGSLQITRPTFYATLDEDIEADQVAAGDAQAGRLLTHVTMYSVPQARSSDGGIDSFTPQYARLQLADNVVVSVLSSCVGDTRKMELINELGAAWTGGLDSCLRLVCHAKLENLELGYYNYLLYQDQRSEGEQCFESLQVNGIGAQVNTPFSKIRIISAGADSCEGTKFMVLEPKYSGTSIKLQDVLYYQAYRLHALSCSHFGVNCIRRKLVLAGYSGARIIEPPLPTITPSGEINNSIETDSSVSTGRQLPRPCTHLLCDSRTRLQPTNVSDFSIHDRHPQTASVDRLRVRIDNDDTKELNNMCYLALQGSKMSRRLYAELGSIEVNVKELGVSLVFSLLKE